MGRKVKTHRDIIEALGSPSEMAKFWPGDYKLMAQKIHMWRLRNNIPSKYWPVILKIAETRRRELANESEKLDKLDLTLDQLMRTQK